MIQCGLWVDGEKSQCPLEQQCARGDVFALIARLALTESQAPENAGCWDFNRGYHCGATLAYYEAAILTEQLAALDAANPITHFARIDKIPGGEAPLGVREQLEGLTFHVRNNLQPKKRNSPVMIHPLDFMLQLHDSGKLSEAAWYQQYAGDRAQEGKQVKMWQFEADEVKLWENLVPHVTAAEYGQNAWTMAMLGSVWTGYIVPQELFDPNSDRGKELFDRLRQEYGESTQSLSLTMVLELIDNMNLISVAKRGPGRTTTTDVSTGEVIEVWDDGVLAYKRS